MMSKTEAAEFLRQLAHESPGDGSQPRVILVKASRELKTFVSSALETLEDMSRALKEADAPASLDGLADALEAVEARAADLELPALGDAFRYAVTLAAAFERCDWLTQARRKVTFASLLKYLSAALLRVYVDGHDENCGMELLEIRRLINEASPNHACCREAVPERELMN
ncbi:MAG: hypothetical protein RJA70_3724 [Pseudomonadota bacterium]|jgi:hypothetical protein